MAKATFSIPAYLTAAGAGSLSMAILLALLGGLPGVMVFALPATLIVMPFLFPAILLGIHLANRFEWHTRWHFFWYSSISSVVTGGVLFLFRSGFEPPQPPYLAWLLGAAALWLCGGLAGLAYRRVMLWDQRSRGATLF